MDPFDLQLWPKFIEVSQNRSSPAVVDQIVIDSRRIDSKNSLFVALKGNNHNGHHFVKEAAKSGAKYALVDHEWHPDYHFEGLTLLRVKSPLKAFQEIAESYRKQLSVKMVAIAGSYGKTMVKDLLTLLLSQSMNVAASPESFNSQIGVPLSLFTINKDHQIAIIEAAVSRPNEMDSLANMIVPDFALLTHIGKKHLRTLGSLENAAVEMLKMLKKVPAHNRTILPSTPLLDNYLTEIPSQTFFWNKHQPDFPHANMLNLGEGAKMHYQVDFPDGFKFLGEAKTGFYYFLDLVNITVKAAWMLGIPSDKISSVLQNYCPEPMRTEIWKSPEGSTFINDTYCSDPQSIDRALKYFDQIPSENSKFFIFGGIRSLKQAQEVEYRRVGQAIKNSSINNLMLVGDHAFQPLINEVKLEPSLVVSRFQTLSEAFEYVRPRLKHGDGILIKGDRKEPLEFITEAFNDSLSNNQCLINLAAIEENILIIRQKLSEETRIMVMVKALAYGTDEVRIAKFLENCGIDILGVSYVDEGVALKKANVTQSIFVINTALHELSKIVKWDLEVGVSHIELIEGLSYEAAKQNKVIKVHLHVDTGMSRFGCRPEEALMLAQTIARSPSLKLEGIMTHFACADNPNEDAFTYSQADALKKIVEAIRQNGITVPWVHASNSSAVSRFDFSDFNMVRIGLAIYGLHASKASEESLSLRLALSLISRIVGINQCKKGETISYGRSYEVKRDVERIAVLPIGYFDGLHRNYSGKGHVIIRGHKAPMVGKICMDFMMVDITDIFQATIGDHVLIFGEDEYSNYLSPNEFADRGESIVHELITCLGPRIQRIFIYEEAFRKY